MRSVSGLIFKQPNWEVVAAVAGEEEKGGRGGTKGEGKRKQVLEKEKGKRGKPARTSSGCV